MRRSDTASVRQGEAPVSISHHPRVAASPIPWDRVRRVLVVRLRSIGDTVLSTPSLLSLRRFLPNAEIDILLEDWVAPLLDGFDEVNNVITVGRTGSERLKTARELRRRGYDVSFNLHGGTTATFFTFASGAPHRVAYKTVRYRFLYNHLLDESSPSWPGRSAHSAQQQLALLELAGVPIKKNERANLKATASAKASLEKKIGDSFPACFALIHPTAAFATKTWAVENFARTAEFLQSRGLPTVAIAAANEKEILNRLEAESKVAVSVFHDLALPEITALASRAALFVGNDSGIAHIAAAVNTPSVVVFGSSNINFWRPWTDAPNEVVYAPFDCQPCPGDRCREFGQPRCILEVPAAAVFDAIDRVVAEKEKRRELNPAVI